MLDRAIRTLLVLAVVLMVNYLSATFSKRHYLSSQTSVQLATRTLSVLHSLTNNVEVTLYFDRRSDFYPDVAGLLDEYAAANKKISVRLVDYQRDPGEAQKIKTKYGLNTAADKDLIIFDSDKRVKMIPSTALLEYGARGMTADKQVDIRPVRFNGERAFTAMLLALENPQPLKAYFLMGHGEVSPSDSSTHGFQKFAQQLQQNYFALAGLKLNTGGDVPADCNLLVIAGPRMDFSELELQSLEKYLHEGGRLFVLFNTSSLERATHLEPLLQRWGVQVVSDYVAEADRSDSSFFVSRYGKHPVTSVLTEAAFQIVLPRPVSKIAGVTVNAVQVDELLFSSDNSTLSDTRTAPPQSYSLACAIEQKPIVGVVNPRGNTRLVVTGDSLFLGNTLIEQGCNSDFLNSAVNWLVERPQLVEGVGPRPITEFRLLLTEPQHRQLNWLLLGALPGGVLLLGWLVWLVRRQ